MYSAEFDPHARTYQGTLDQSLRFAGETTAEFAAMKVDLILDASRRLLGQPSRLSFLDVGCGTGLAARALRSRAGRVVGADVSAEMIGAALEECPEVDFVPLEGPRLPFADGEFDVQFCACVYHHVPLRERRAFVAELVRVVRPGGLLFVFEHNPWNPLTRRVVDRCPFDRDAILLTAGETRGLLEGAGLKVAEQRYYLFFPRVLGCLRRLEPWLGWLPLGAQYYVAARKPG
jgi:SAM-dependent methyltransferase